MRLYWEKQDSRPSTDGSDQDPDSDIEKLGDRLPINPSYKDWTFLRMDFRQTKQMRADELKLLNRRAGTVGFLLKGRSMRDPLKSAPSRSPLLSAALFFFVVFAWSWSFWFLAAALGASVKTPLGAMLMHTGLLGPMLGGIGFTYFTRSRDEWRDYWQRIFDPRRIPARWLLVIVLFTPALLGLAVLLDLATGGTAVLEQIGVRVVPFLAAPLTVLPFAAHVLVYGPFPEELGWRGYVLDRLQARWNALTSSLVLGTLWALFHYPLFFIRDADPHYVQGVWSPWFWQFMIGIVPSAVIYTWIYNNTRRSTLAAILFHFTSNFTYLLVNTTAGTNFYSTLLLIVVAITVVAFWGADTLTRAEHNL